MPVRLCSTPLGKGCWNCASCMLLYKEHEERHGGRGSTIRPPCIPVMPGYKFASEVATMELVRFNTSVLFQRIWLYNDFDLDDDDYDGNPSHYASPSSPSTFPGYGWIPLDKAAGEPYANIRQTIRLNAKLAPARTLADRVHSLASYPSHLSVSLYLGLPRPPPRPPPLVPHSASLFLQQRPPQAPLSARYPFNFCRRRRQLRRPKNTYRLFHDFPSLSLLFWRSSYQGSRAPVRDWACGGPEILWRLAAQVQPWPRILRQHPRVCAVSCPFSTCQGKRP